MDTIISSYYVIDNKIFKSHNINSEFDSSDYILYEVLRTTNGILLFLEDHLKRLKGALEKIGLKDLYNEKEAIENMNSLLCANSNQKGNIKLLCRKCDSKLQYASYYVPHAYPNEKAYAEGVDLATFVIERIDPGIKQIKINEYIKQKLEVTSLTKNVYDVLLINKRGLITEGSRSNFFLVKGEIIYSAEEFLILPGITRKYVIDAAHDLNIEIVEKELKLEEIRNYEAAFLSGTSPKVLPVKKIDNCHFKADHPVLRRIRGKFEEIYRFYINSRI
jgi:branched-chain amino acid aminotransferase